MSFNIHLDFGVVSYITQYLKQITELFSVHTLVEISSKQKLTISSLYNDHHLPHEGAQFKQIEAAFYSYKQDM